MTFEEALAHLRAGKRIKLARWTDDMYAYWCVETESFRIKGHEKMNARADIFLRRALIGPWEIVE